MNLAQVTLYAHPAQSSPVGITCRAGGRNHPSYRSVKEVGENCGKLFSYFLEALLALNQSLFTSVLKEKETTSIIATCQQYGCFNLLL